MKKMNRFSAYLVSSWALALFVGCEYVPSVGPDYKSPEMDVPAMTLPDANEPSDEDIRVNISTNELAQWWTKFDDPILIELVNGAETNNLAYKRAAKNLLKAEYELIGANAAFYPKFGVGAGLRRNWAHAHASTTGRRTSYNAKTAALEGSWEIDLFGGNRRRSEAAYKMIEAAEWSLDDTWIALTTQIGLNYVGLRTTQERIAVAYANLKIQEETYEILKSRLDSGIGDELAVNQCAYVVEQTRAAIPQLLVQEEKSKNALAILAGEIPGALADKLEPIEDRRDWLLEPQKVGSLSLNVIRGRPDVMAAECRLAAATANIGVARAQWFPKLEITGQVGFQARNGVNLFDKKSFFAALGPSVSWPILQGGAIYANVKIAETAMEEAALAYEEAIERAYGEVRDAYAAYTQEYHRYESLQVAVKAASDAVTISQDLYKNGLRDFNNVLDAQRSRLQLEEACVVSRGQITLALIELYRALGGGLAPCEY